MLVVKKKFRLGIHPDDKDKVIECMQTLGVLNPFVRYFKTDLGVKENLVKVYIEDSIEEDKLQALMDFVDKNCFIASIEL